MIQAKELRIGNWVWNEVQNLPVKVDIRILNQQYSADRGIGRSWQPIPITEEILLKCGFEKRTENDSFQLDSDLGFTVWGRIKSGLNVYCNSDILGQDIKQLHQLQNLYFALTGKELEINL